MAALIRLTAELALETRRKSLIKNYMDKNPLAVGKLLETNALIQRYPQARPRPTNICASYNCHGLTFSARRTQINDSNDVLKILEEDDYVKVTNIGDVLPGDIVVYFDGSSPEHSGIVVGMNQSIPIIVSKWGESKEFIHSVNNSPYFDLRFEFFRIIS